MAVPRTIHNPPGPLTDQGAYGFRVVGLQAESPWLMPATESSITLAIRHEPWRPEPLPDATGRRFTLAIDATCRLRIERDPGTLIVEAPAAVPDALVVHPYLSYAAATCAQWEGSLALHGGVIALDGRAWVLLADTFGGKTSLLAALAQRSFTVLSDDLAIIDRDATVRPGPRCLDLRPAASRALQPCGQITSVRRRSRLMLGPAPLNLPLGGFVVLRWGRAVSVDHVGVVERSEILIDSRTAWGPSSASALLDILDAPFIALSRPRRFSAIDETIEVLVAGVRSQPSYLQR
jgi:hypothetical protein